MTPERVSDRPIRLAVVISHPIQHFAPLFRCFADHPDVDLKVLYCCDWGSRQYRDPGFGKAVKWDIPLLDGYNYEFLPIRRRPSSLGFREIDNPCVADRLDVFAPDAVWVHGYAHRTSWRVLRWAQGRAKVLYFGDSELLAPRRLPARVIKRMVLPGFFRRCDAFITIGDNNEAYYRYYGVRQEKMFRGAFPVDVGRFQRAVSESGAAERADRRGKMGLAAGGFVALFVGKFIAIKRPLDFVRAVDRLRTAAPGVQGLMIGSGGLEPAIRGEIAGRGLTDRIRLAGFVNQSAMPEVLHAGDVIVMCSEKDPHPLAVTEAMAAGNAVVASDRVGCVGPTDAARPGVNALTYPCGDVESLTIRLQTLADDPALLRSMSQESMRIAWSQDASVAADAVIRAARTVLNRRPNISMVSRRKTPTLSAST